jgi:abortive infection bacteriophage resistance protein
MPKVPYAKPALTFAQQLSQLKGRGLNVEDDSRALHLLETISYFRLSGYWYPMLDMPKQAHNFKPNSSFDTGFKMYCFDKELRRLISSELEKVEVAIRSKMIYIMSHAHGAFWYRNNSLFRNANRLSETLNKLTNEYSKSDEDFIKSFDLKYSDPLPPSWMILEISSLGNLSHIFKNLRPSRHKRNIANYFLLSESVLESWIHSIVYVRNVCAHHARLWSRKMSISPNFPVAPSGKWIMITTLPNPIAGFPPVNINNTTYYLLCMVNYLLSVINPKNTFKTKLNSLLVAYPTIDIKAMGFPIGWEKEQLWK